MLLYLFIFIIPIVAYFTGPAQNRNKKFLLCYMTALMIFVGLSDMFGGYDRYIYGGVFDRIADGISDGNNYESISAFKHFEIGYSTLSYIIALITENRYIYIFIITALIYFFIYKSFERVMPNYPLAMIIFLGMMFFFTFTYLRQVLAFSIAWYGTRYFIDKKYWKFIIIIAIVTLMHKSGIVFAGLCLIPKKKFSTGAIVVTLLICGIIGISGLAGAMYDTFINVSEIQVRQNYSTEDSSRIAYIVEVAFFTWLILSNYNKIEPTRKNLILMNMAWCFCALLLLFMKSSDGGRVAWFFTYGIIYTSTLVCIPNHSQIRLYGKNVLSSFIMVVMLVLYMRIYIAWQHYNNLYPYKTFLTDGVRYPDYSWDLYEYDHNYDMDKFYRPAFRFLK